MKNNGISENQRYKMFDEGLRVNEKTDHSWSSCSDVVKSGTLDTVFGIQHLQKIKKNLRRVYKCRGLFFVDL